MIPVKYPLIYYLLFFSIALLSSACEDKTLPPLNIVSGQPFPNVVLKNLDGKDVSFDASSGKVQVINIWATWCGPCRYELPSLQRLKLQLDNTKFDVIGISVDSDNYLVREFLLEQKINYLNFLDADMTIANNVLGVHVYPSTYLVNSDGIIEEVIQGWREWDDPDLIVKIRKLSKK